MLEIEFEAQGRDTTMKPKSILAFALLCAIWGSTWAAISVLVQDVPPLRSAAVRFLLAGVVLLVVVAIKRLSV